MIKGALGESSDVKGRLGSEVGSTCEGIPELSSMFQYAVPQGPKKMQMPRRENLGH